MNASEWDQLSQLMGGSAGSTAQVYQHKLVELSDSPSKPSMNGDTESWVGAACGRPCLTRRAQVKAKSDNSELRRSVAVKGKNSECHCVCDCTLMFQAGRLLLRARRTIRVVGGLFVACINTVFTHWGAGVGADTTRHCKQSRGAAECQADTKLRADGY